MHSYFFENASYVLANMVCLADTAYHKAYIFPLKILATKIIRQKILIIIFTLFFSFLGTVPKDNI